MKSLIIVLALVAFSKAQDVAAPAVTFEGCMKDVFMFKGCVMKQMAATFDTDTKAAVGKMFHDLDGCFDADGVKGVCTKPHQPPPQSARPAFPELPAGVAECATAAKTNFINCFKDKVQLSEAALKKGEEMMAAFGPGGSGGPQGGPPGGPMGPGIHEHFVDHAKTPAEIQSQVAKTFCSGDEEAAKKLMTAAFEVIKPNFELIKKIKMAPCQALATCAKDHKFSEGCPAKLKEGAQAFCDCGKATGEFFKTGEQCSAARSAAKEHFEQMKAKHDAETASIAVAHNAELPQHPQFPLFDFCDHLNDASAEKHFNVCKAMEQKLAEHKPAA